MRLSSLVLAAILTISITTWAQHSSSGGSSGGSTASGAPSGGSHGGGGSSYSGAYSGGSSAGHSYSGSTSGGRSSGGHSSPINSGGHSWSGSTVSGSNLRGTMVSGKNSDLRAGKGGLSDFRYSLRGLNLPSQLRPVQPEKRGFLATLRHPFRKPEPAPKVQANIVRPICFRGSCPVCPGGVTRAGGCTGAPVIPTQQRYPCSYSGIWNGSSCIMGLQLWDDCGGLRMALEQQLMLMQQAEIAMQNTCQGNEQECSTSTAAWNSQLSLYRALQSRFRSCLAQSASVFPFGGYMIGYGPDLLFEPVALDFN
jgi:hypothetical protein